MGETLYRGYLRVCPDVEELTTDAKKVERSPAWPKCFFLLTQNQLLYAAPFSEEVMQGADGGGGEPGSQELRRSGSQGARKPNA